MRLYTNQWNAATFNLTTSAQFISTFNQQN